MFNLLNLQYKLYHIRAARDHYSNSDDDRYMYHWMYLEVLDEIDKLGVR
jgi:hypothetical protein